MVWISLNHKRKQNVSHRIIKIFKDNVTWITSFVFNLPALIFDKMYWKKTHRYMKFISGYFFFQNAMALAYGSNLQLLDKDCAISMRSYVLHQLLEASSMPPAQRTLCDMVGCAKPGQREPWIVCAVCGRWSHFSCVQVTEAPIEGFIFPICVARYG